MCQNLSAFPEKQAAVQKYANQLMLVNNCMQNIPSVILLLFLGSWSDKYGRKVPLLMPLIGNFVTTLLTIVSLNFYFV